MMNEAARKLADLVCAESQRWRSLTVAGWLSDRKQSQLLQVPAPRLININICDLHFGAARSIRLTPDGPPLRDVVLGYVALDWDCSRLRGLRTLRIQGLEDSQPTLLQLHTIISSSPELEVLALVFWDRDHWGSAHSPPRLDIIKLDFLNTLILDSIDPVVAGGISSSIIAPKCKNLKIDGVRVDVVQDQNAASRLADLLHGPSKGASALFLDFDNALGEIILGEEEDSKDDVELNIREATSKLAKRRGLYFKTAFTSSAEGNNIQTWNNLLPTLTGNVLEPALLGLNVPVQLQFWDPFEELSPEILFTAFGFITSLELGKSSGIISAIDYLASPQPHPGKDSDNKQQSWACPRLEKVTILWDDSDCQDLRDALDRVRGNRAECLLEAQMDSPQGFQLEDHRPCSIKEMTIKGSDGDVLQTWSEEGWIVLEIDQTSGSGGDSSPIEEPE
ncbi:hypothetical protein FRC01_010476 [Tulasnella sp. 417]|nr:hypothetical protein FRC01_010476 [Tulasnella sp. 417]